MVLQYNRMVDQVKRETFRKYQSMLGELDLQIVDVFSEQFMPYYHPIAHVNSYVRNSLNHVVSSAFNLHPRL